jgi:acetyl-CoA acyltransferase
MTGDAADTRMRVRKLEGCSMPDVVVAGFARSPFHLAGKGALARTRPDDLAGAVVRGLVERTGVDVSAIEDLVVGCAFPKASRASTSRV